MNRLLPILVIMPVYFAKATEDNSNDCVYSSPQQVVITSPKMGTFLSAETLGVEISATAREAESVQFLLDDEPLGEPDTTPPFSVSWDVASFSAGPHKLTAQAAGIHGTYESEPVLVAIELIAGVGTKLGQLNQKQEIDVILERMKQMHANFFRDGRAWDQIEKRYGEYNFNDTSVRNIKQLAQNAAQYGIHGMTSLDYGNELYPHVAEDAPEGREAYANFCKAFVREMTGKIRVFSVWNEFPGGLGVPDFNNDGASWDDATEERYFELLRTAYPKIKEGNPDAIVMGPVTVKALDRNVEYLKKLKALGAASYLDWLDMHAYPENDDTARPEDSARWLAEEIHPIFPDKPILISEYGYKSQGERTQMDKAEMVARTYMSFRIIPNLRGVIWYELRDSGTDPNEHKDMFGLCTKDDQMTPYPAFYTYQDVVPVFKTALFYGRGVINKNTWLLKFRDKDGDLFVAWREPDGDSTLNFSFTASMWGSLSARQVKTSSDEPKSKMYSFKTGTNTIRIPLSTWVQFIRVPKNVQLTPDETYGFENEPIR